MPTHAIAELSSPDASRAHLATASASCSATRAPAGDNAPGMALLKQAAGLGMLAEQDLNWPMARQYR